MTDPATRAGGLAEDTPLIMKSQNGAERWWQIIEDETVQEPEPEPRAPAPIVGTTKGYRAEAVGQAPKALKMLWGVTTTVVVALAGLILAANVATLPEIAKRAGTDERHLRTVYTVRGAGIITGAFLSAFVYQALPASYVLCIVFLAQGGGLFGTAYVRNAFLVNLLFFLTGLSVALMAIGAQVIIRGAAGKDAGPWLQIQQLGFALLSVFLPLTEYIRPNVNHLYITLSIVSWAVGVWIVTAHLVETLARGKGVTTDDLVLDTAVPINVAESEAAAIQAEQGLAGNVGELKHEHPAPSHSPIKKDVWRIQRYRREMIFGVMLFCIMGGNEAVVSYIASYMNQRSLAVESSRYNALVLIFYGVVAFSRFVAVFDQYRVRTTMLYFHTAACFLAALGGAAVTAIKDVWALRLGLIIYAAFIGPTVGFVLDLNNRMTRFSGLGTAVPNIWMHVGGVLVPFIVSEVWIRGGGPQTLPWTLVVTSTLPLVFLGLTLAVRNDYSHG